MRRSFFTLLTLVAVLGCATQHMPRQSRHPTGDRVNCVALAPQSIDFTLAARNDLGEEVTHEERMRRIGMHFYLLACSYPDNPYGFDTFQRDIRIVCGLGEEECGKACDATWYDPWRNAVEQCRQEEKR